MTGPGFDMQVRRRRFAYHRICIYLFVLLSSATTLAGQVLMRSTGADSTIRVHNTDLAVFEAKETRKDLPCVVSPDKPVLGFDLRFHATYEVAVPLKDLAGRENLLTILFRVTSRGKPGGPIYFMQRVRVPEIEEDAKGDAYLQGSFDVGEGHYDVEWLMRDRAERVCSHFWDVRAELPERDKEMALTVSTGAVLQSEQEQFEEEPPVIRSAADETLHVRILVNFAPQNARAATLQGFDTSALVSILRSIAREPRIGRFSVVAFNLQEQRVVYRQENSNRIDFPALGASLDSLNLGTVDLKRLGDEHGETRFLAELIRQEVPVGVPLDAVVFAGPKALLEKNIPEAELADVAQVPYPVFYMNYNLYPRANPWRDAIGSAVKFMKGYEYSINRPRDLWFSVSEMVSRILKSKGERSSARTRTE